MNSLRLLLKHLPSWVRVEKDSPATAQVTCAPQKASGLIAGHYLLTLTLLRGGGVGVAEGEGANHFPASCPERHINPDATFCISYGSTEPLIEAHAAVAWWEYLRMFLVHQEYARKYGVWPLEGGLSHGDAARVQEKMEELAAPLGWKEEILIGMFRAKGWLANSLPKASHRLDRLLNSRTPCPRGCMRQADRNRSIVCRLANGDTEITDGKPILRAECPNRSILERIALLEHKRRKAQNDFILDFCKDAPECCGTMKHCPLAESSS